MIGVGDPRPGYPSRLWEYGSDRYVQIQVCRRPSCLRLITHVSAPCPSLAPPLRPSVEDAELPVPALRACADVLGHAVAET